MLNWIYSKLHQKYGAEHDKALALDVADYLSVNPQKQALPVPVPIGGVYGKFGLSDRANVRELLKANHTWVYRAVQINAQNLAKQPIALYIMRGDERERIISHPLLEVLRKPNPVQTRFDLWELTWSYLELAGNSYWYKAKNALGVTREIWPIRPDLMRPVPDANEIIKGYLYEFQGKKIAFTREEIVHIMYPNPETMWLGLSPLHAARYLYDTDFFMRNWNISMFKNSARPDGVLQTDALLDEAGIERTRKAWHDAFGGTENSHKTAVLQQGLKYHQLSLGNKDLEFLASIQASKEDVFEMFGVPPALAGIVKDVNRANGDAQLYIYSLQTLLPRLCKMQERLSNSMAHEIDPRLFFEFENPVPEDKEFKLKERESNLKNFVTDINEEREQLGKDAAAWGDGPWMGFNLVQFGDSFAGSNSELSSPVFMPKSIRPTRSIIFREDFRLAAWKAFDQVARSNELAFQRTMHKLFNEQRRTVIKNLRQAKAYKADDALIDFILFDEEAWATVFRERTEKEFLNAVLAGSKKAIADIAAGTDFNINSPIVKAFLQDKQFKFSFDTNQTTLGKLRETLEAGLDLDENFEALAARVNKVFDFSETARAKRIARTEINTSTNFGIHDAYRQSQIVEQKNWLSQRDGDVRESHQLDNEVIALNESFSNGLLYPGDPGGDPGEIIHCRCTTLPVVV